MPAPKRPTSGTSRPSSTSKQQATLSFNHRVTKSVPKSAKKGLATPPSTAPSKQSPLAKHVASTSDQQDPADIDVEDEDVDVTKAQVEEAEAPEKTEAELRAEKVSDRQIDQYWRQLERERKTKRVHQGDLALAEKVLRYWDVSSQYGPCVGISRMKRWQRAERLGLNPPVEVLAVLMKEESRGAQGFEKAHMDEILNSTAVGST
ncbi:Uu.00g069930.m01.CDS01 [Anthostomella pinea]|uniref:Uu.00g069930.m01.CDS01 n=1 Tax=Anthostomella pinea TaxID=933095 RepID=A0AAI8VVT6_9PEZI|nr:Uu.00g069930.m01.CDS01 [Anthostomella pinea]